MRRLLPLLFLAISLPVFGQVVANDPATTYGRCANNDVLTKDNRAKSANAAAIKEAIGLGRGCNLPIVEQYVLDHPPQFSNAQLQQMAQNLLTYVEQARQDKQVGSSNGSNGTTSLVSKGVGAIVGVALESGSIQRSTSGNVATVTINTAQGIDFLSGGHFKPCAIIESDCSFGRKILSAFTVGTAYDVSQANTSTNSTPAEDALSSLVGSNDPAFTGVSARFDFHATRKNVPIDKLVTAYQASAYQTPTVTYAAAYSSLSKRITTDPDYLKYIKDALDQLQNTNVYDTDPKVDVILTTLKINIADLINQKAPATLAFQTYTSAENVYRGARDAALSAVLYKWSGSLEYNYNRLPSQPDESDFKAIYSYRNDTNEDKILQVTANAGATIYNSTVGSSTSRIRSSQAAFQLDYTVTSPSSKIQTVVSGGYYFQYMVANGLLTLPATQLAPGTAIPLPNNASELLNTTGPIHIGQGKVTLNVKGTSVSIPLALTFSNRTDLIKASKVGGNFGITYDFSSLFGGLK